MEGVSYLSHKGMARLISDHERVLRRGEWCKRSR
jgi:hypothetical protein